MSSELGGGAGLCQNPSHMQPRGLWGCEAAPPRAGPRNEARPSWRKGSLHHPSTGPTLAVWFSGGGGSNEAVGRDWVFGSLSWTLSPTTAISPPPVTQPSGHHPGLPWERFWQAQPPSAFLWRTLRRPSGFHLDWGGGCGTGAGLPSSAYLFLLFVYH